VNFKAELVLPERNSDNARPDRGRWRAASIVTRRKGGGAVERTGLENRHQSNLIVGSNPTPSANAQAGGTGDDPRAPHSPLKPTDAKKPSLRCVHTKCTVGVAARERSGSTAHHRKSVLTDTCSQADTLTVPVFPALYTSAISTS
jgi:hypothetical protein